MLFRSEDELLDAARECGIGVVAFSPLAQGLLTNKYFGEIPEDSRAKSQSVFLTPESITASKVEKAKRLNLVAEARGQSLAQMALAWILRRPEMTSVIIGARTPWQIMDNLSALNNLSFAEEELRTIDDILSE